MWGQNFVFQLRQELFMLWSTITDVDADQGNSGQFRNECSLRIKQKNVGINQTENWWRLKEIKQKIDEGLKTVKIVNIYTIALHCSNTAA